MISKGAGGLCSRKRYREVQTMLLGLINAELDKWKTIHKRDLPALNRMVRELGVDVVRVKEE
ncbi:MAG: hypothetical protein ACKVU2_05175 [Saprospiraceae bacterium]